MLSMVLLVLLLCFEPAKAGLLEPAKAAMFSLLLQPAKARPPLPWWRVRVWENRYFLCNPDGWIRELEDEEADELDDVFDDNTAASKYVWAESAQHLAGNCWRVSWEEPRYWWYQYQTPNNAGTPDYYQHWEDWISWQPVQGYGARSQPGQGYGQYSQSSNQPAQGYRSTRSNSRPPARRPTNEPAKAAPKKDVLQHMYRGQGAKMKRTARRALLAAGLEVPGNLKPGKAITDLPEPEKARAKALQKRLKELRFSKQYSTSQVEWEVGQIKAQLHGLLGPQDESEDDEDEVELERAEQVNKELQAAIEMAKQMSEALTQQCNGTMKTEESTPMEPAQATPMEPAQATPVEPAKADEMPTGDTEESEAEEEEEKGWHRVGDTKKKKKQKLKKTSKEPEKNN